MARISVLMGIYNCAPYLQEALDSLYAQTYQDFKIILCDDGSKDDTYAIAKRNASEHPNIVLIKNEYNMGLNYTLNRCLEYADSEYCARMDGDDISLPTRFEKEIKFLDEHPEYAIVSCPMIYFDEDGEFGRGRGDGEPSKYAFISGTPFCHAPCMVRTEAYKKVNGYTVDKKLLRVEDYHLWTKMFAAGYKGYNLSECLYAMRDDKNAIRRRRWKGTINEVRAHIIATKELRLGIKGLIFSLRPIFVKILPRPIYKYLHKKVR
jgi:glycosyltransferase EpsE